MFSSANACLRLLRRGTALRGLQASQGCGQRTAQLHYGVDTQPKQTCSDVVAKMTQLVGASGSFAGQDINRQDLLADLPRSQDDLPPRHMEDSYDSAIIPLGSDPALREKYLTFMGGVRVGRLLEDLDVFAVWLCYRHIHLPDHPASRPSPYTIVTAMVDRMDFAADRQLDPLKDIKVSGHLSWAGRSSMEALISVEQMDGGVWRQVTRAVFVMVARDPLNQGAAPVNRLVPRGEVEAAVFQQGVLNRLARRRGEADSLFRQPPNETEKSLVHDLFMSTADASEHSFSARPELEPSVSMADTKIKNLIICHPESQNIHGKIFGGFLMRQAFELAWINCYVVSGQRAVQQHIDDIIFRRPVEIGSLLYLSSQVVYTEGRHLQVSTKAAMMDPITRQSQLTNIFHFTFAAEGPVQPVKPRTYPEAMLYLDGRRHYQLARGERRYYGQQEAPEDD